MALKPSYEEGFDATLDTPTPSKIIVPGSEWRDRVILELEDLTDKIVRLRQFMTSKEYYVLSASQACLMRDQAKAMSKYADILIDRLRCSR